MPFQLKSSPPPSKRALEGRSERNSKLYGVANRGYDLVEGVVKAVRSGRNELSRKVSEGLGVRTVSEFERVLEPSFAILRILFGFGDNGKLWRLYGKERGRWHFDHVTPISSVIGKGVGCLRFVYSVHNLEAVTWEENQRRRWRKADDPLQIVFYFYQKGCE